MNLEKIWNHPSPQEIKDQIKRDIIERDEEMMMQELEKDSNSETVDIYEDAYFKFQSSEKILEDVSEEEIYLWYSQAMQRRGREPLEIESFFNHFFNEGSYHPTFSYGDKEKGYLLGFNKFGVFTPTHFAPKTLRGGYDLFAALSDSNNVPAILAITEDLADTLKKMPNWHKLDINKDILSFFRGELVKKEIFYNSHPEVQNLMIGLLMDYLNEEDDNLDIKTILDSSN
ncbi:MAG: hypothetical protein PHG95_03085 [Patescibacteria group bacterium]|nr:hypothetical protein [Patescibacteria group bacterium]